MEGLRRTLQLVRWSRLTSLASTFSLIRITIWSVNVRQGSGVFLDLHPPMLEILRAVSYLDFWKPNIFFVFTFSCLLGSGCSGCSSSIGLLNIIKRQEHACFCHKLVQLLQLDHHQVQVAVHLPSSRQQAGLPQHILLFLHHWLHAPLELDNQAMHTVLSC